MDQNTTQIPSSSSTPSTESLNSTTTTTSNTIQKISATEILQRRQRFLAKRWKRHEYALLDIFTITFPFIDVRKHFLSLALVNKWFYNQVHESLANIEELECIDDREIFPTNRLAMFLDKLYKVKILNNYRRFEVDQEVDEQVDYSVMDDLDAQMDELEVSVGIFNRFRSVFNSFANNKEISLEVPSVKPKNEKTLLKRVVIYVKITQAWYTFKKYKIEQIFMVGMIPKYGSDIPDMDHGPKYDHLTFFRCGNLIQRLYSVSETFSDLEKVTFINSIYTGITAPFIKTSTMEIDRIVEMMQEYDLFRLSPSIVQYHTDEIMEYVKFEKVGNAASGNSLWKALKAQERLYPYLQQVFGDLGKYYLKLMLSEMTNISEKNFRTFLEKWNSTVQVKKIRLEFMITNTIFCDSIIEDLIREATAVDNALEKRKSLAIEKCKLESLSKWMADLYKNRTNKKKFEITFK